ncbi:MAG TPA: molybdopterin molybdenumtransferase MoeA, partial [Bacillota bacterium]
HGIALKPGKPTLVATLGECLLIGLPGNPVSALVIYHLLVRPALWRRMGLARPPRRASCRARLSKAVRRPATREELVRVRLIERDGSLWAEPLSGSSGVLQSLAQADGLVWISFANERYAAGEEVEVWLLPERVDGSG